MNKMEKSKYDSMSEKKKNIKDMYFLSPMQEGMLYHSIKDNQDYAYIEQILVSVKGKIQIECVEKSFNKLIEKYDVFRTVFSYKKTTRPVQIVMKEKKVGVEYLDISNLNEDEKVKAIEEFKENDKKRGFDLTKEIAIRMAMIKTYDNSYNLLLSFHHIIMDGWCTSVIFKEFFEVYDALIENRDIDLEKAKPFSEYIKWLEKQNKEEGISYWESYLKGYEQIASIPQADIKHGNDLYKPESKVFIIDKDIRSSLEDMAKNNNTTLNTIMQTAWGILLQKYNNTNDVVYGAVVSGRPYEIRGIENMVGLFINTIPVRIQCEGDQSFEKLLKEAQQSAIQAEKYSYYSLGEIQSKTQLKNRLINHIMIFENFPIKETIESSDDKNSEYTIDDIKFFEQTNYDFNIIIYPSKELKIEFFYNTLMYDRKFIDNIESHFKSILQQVVNKQDTMVKNINILTELEKKKILFDFNDTKTEYPKNKTIYELFEEQVERTPDKIAIVFHEEKLTYRKLNEKANRLARGLRRKGVKPDNIIAIMMERSVEMAIGIIGILKAGGAYLPIDPEYTSDRIEYMIEDSKADVVLTKKQLVDKANVKGQILTIEDEISENKDESNLDKINKESDLAYVIYTSGSTGKPKGVMIEHHSISNTIQWRRNEYRFESNDTVLQLLSYSFDGFVVNFFTSIACGAKVVILNEIESKDPVAIKKYLVSEKVTHFAVVPSMYSILLQYMGESEIKELKIITLAGEKATPEIIRQSKEKNSQLELVNEYGPTENSVTTTILRNMDETSNIGRPIANTRIFILNKDDGIQPIGVIGELCISGEGLARGYLNREELTSEKFVLNPVTQSEMMYRTGDMARWLPEGNIEFIGRKDRQVKIRGFRIELGEIENLLIKFPDVKEAIVLLREDKIGEKRLVAYIVMKEGKVFYSIDLQRYLHEKLPEYMIPSAFVPIGALPLTINGKVDESALPIPDRVRPELEKDYVAPRTPIEKKLAEMWIEILGIEKIGINDNFFELGGHSLLSLKLANKIRDVYNIELPLSFIFEAPYIEKLALGIIEEQSKKEKEEMMASLLAELEKLSDDEAREMVNNNEQFR